MRSLIVFLAALRGAVIAHPATVYDLAGLALILALLVVAGRGGSRRAPRPKPNQNPLSDASGPAVREIDEDGLRARLHEPPTGAPAGSDKPGVVVFNGAGAGSPRELDPG